MNKEKLNNAWDIIIIVSIVAGLVCSVLATNIPALCWGLATLSGFVAIKHMEEEQLKLYKENNSLFNDYIEVVREKLQMGKFISELKEERDRLLIQNRELQSALNTLTEDHITASEPKSKVNLVTVKKTREKKTETE